MENSLIHPILPVTSLWAQTFSLRCLNKISNVLYYNATNKMLRKLLWIEVLLMFV